MKIPEDAVPLCAGQHELFDSVHIHDHAIARRICNGDTLTPACPVREWCQHRLQVALDKATSSGGEDNGPQGTWCGQLVGVRKPAKKPAAA